MKLGSLWNVPPDTYTDVILTDGLSRWTLYSVAILSLNFTFSRESQREILDSFCRDENYLSISAQGPVTHYLCDIEQAL